LSLTSFYKLKTKYKKIQEELEQEIKKELIWVENAVGNKKEVLKKLKEQKIIMNTNEKKEKNQNYLRKYLLFGISIYLVIILVLAVLIYLITKKRKKNKKI